MSRTMALVLSALLIVSCAFITRLGNNISACEQSDPLLMKELIDALVSAAELDFAQVAADLIPNPDVRRCDLEAIIAAAENTDGGFTYAQMDGGTVRVTSALQLAESDKERCVRRAKFVLAAMQ